MVTCSLLLSESTADFSWFFPLRACPDSSGEPLRVVVVSQLCRSRSLVRSTLGFPQPLRMALGGCLPAYASRSLCPSGLITPVSFASISPDFKGGLPWAFSSPISPRKDVYFQFVWFLLNHVRVMTSKSFAVRLLDVNSFYSKSF